MRKQIAQYAFVQRLIHFHYTVNFPDEPEAGEKSNAPCKGRKESIINTVNIT
jgi:hypothetical protein